MKNSNSDFDTLWRVYLVYGLMLLFAIAVIVKIIYIQVAERDELLEYAAKADTRIVEVPAMRGNVFSKNNTIIATTIPVYDIFFDPVAVKDEVFDRDVRGLSDSLSVMFRDYSKSQYVSRFNKARANKKRYVKIARRLTKNEYERIKTFPIFREKRGNGLIAEKHFVRERPYGDIAMRTVGYVSGDSLNPVKVGLEGAYDTCLVGKNGVQMRRRVNGGRFIDVPASVNVLPQNGKDIYTSIDIEMQDLAEEALRRCLIENKAAQG